MKRLVLTLLLCTPCFGSWQTGVKPPIGTQIDGSDSINRGLVGLWLMNEGCGNTVQDLSGNARHGSMVSLTWQAGRHGPSILFPDSTSSKITIPRYPGIQNQIATEFRCFFNRNYADSSFQGLVTALSGYNGSSRCYLTSTNKLVYQEYLNGSPCVVSALSTIVVGSLYHVVCQYTGARMELWINGQLQGTYVDAGPLNTGTAALIVGLAYSTGWPLDGVVSQMRQWSRSLSASEISRLYGEPFAGMVREDVHILNAAISSAPTVLPQVIIIARAGLPVWVILTMVCVAVYDKRTNRREI